MDNCVKVVSYNCRGFPKTPAKLRVKPTVNLLLNDDTIDFICLQETFLSKQDLGCLNSVHNEYQGIGTSTVDTRDGIVKGHPSGGVAILYRTKQAKYITPLYFNLDWVIGISINNNNCKHIILCVYMKTASGGHGDNKEIFQGQLEELKMIIDELDTTSVTIIGDLNADVINPSHPHGPLLKQFSVDNGLIISSELMLPGDSFSFISEMNPGQVSWLDHCVSTQDGHNIINNMRIDYQLACRDHIPLEVELGLDKIPLVEDEVNLVVPKINWDSCSPIKLKEFLLMSDICMSRINVPYDAIECDNINCKLDDHTSKLKLFYDNLCKCLIEASNIVFGVKESKKFDCRPGFNEHVKELHEVARKRFVAWKEANRPRDPDNPFFREMAVSRAKFKLALRFIKRFENQLRQDAIADAMCEESEGNFWKEIKKQSPNNIPLPTSIDGATGKKEVVNMWKDHFKSLLNCVQNHNSSIPSQLTTDPGLKRIPDEIQSAINKLDSGKSCGLDGLYAEHLKHSSNGYKSLLAKCLSGFLSHGYLPESFMTVVLVPIIKDKSGKINNKDNYRPIAIASVLSKLLEKILLERLSNYLLTTSHQFGFKSKHSTDACIYVLKEAVDLYVNQQSNVYLCFLDATKAFDRVNHSVLFDKLEKRGVPGYIIRILAFWYSNQKMMIRWGNIMSESFNVTNGVRQGGILSPYLFNVYMDDLSLKLKKLFPGCRVADKIINHLFYADDLVLLSPSHRGLQELLETCEKYANEHDLIFNTKKSVVMIRRSKLLKTAIVQPFKLSNEVLKEVTEFKYLGYVITADGKDDGDMMRACRQIYAQGNSLIRKFHMCTEKVKIKLFTTYCSQIYCAHLWQYRDFEKAYRKVKVAYNNVFRMFLKLPRDEQGRPCSASGMFANRRVKSFEEILRNVVFKFQCRIDLSENLLVKSTLFAHIRERSKLRKHWNKILHIQEVGTNQP